MTEDERATLTALADEFAQAAERWHERLEQGPVGYATGAYDAYNIAAQRLRAVLKETP